MAPRPDEVAAGLAAFYAAPIEGDERDFTLGEFYTAPPERDGDDAQQVEQPAASDALQMFAELAAAVAVNGCTVVGLALRDSTGVEWAVDLPR